MSQAYPTGAWHGVGNEEELKTWGDNHEKRKENMELNIHTEGIRGSVIWSGEFGRSISCYPYFSDIDTKMELFKRRTLDCLNKI